MNYLSVRDFRNSPRTVWRKLADQGKMVVTNNGKPCALMLTVDGENLEETMEMLEQTEVMRAVNRMRLGSVQKGTNTMTLEEINGIITDTRKNAL
ncbi:hypothetical protein AGMMS50230_09330 [Spirochaetia bacterium]|nr:hypothetical protein AGMMS50230_09330 [Spirochaetia bacterium]